MNTFAQAVDQQTQRTQNGMKALATSANKCVDLFFNIGASRGKQIIPQFVAAFAENKELALRIAQWSRDIRGGAGERKLFRDILVYLEQNDPKSLELLLPKVPELGRWDDLLIFKTEKIQAKAFQLIEQAIKAKNMLCAKWMPRKGEIAVKLRQYMNLSPKGYRKTLVSLTQVVETQMCSGDWNNINFSQVPSVASSRYKQAFARNSATFAEYVNKLVKGEAGVKVNAGAVYPYDVLKGVVSLYGSHNFSKTELDHVVAQWESLPNYVGEASILPMVDVSGSMGFPVAGNTTALEIAVSLGLYLSDKCQGAFKDVFLTFSGNSKVVKLEGNIVQKAQQMVTSDWGMNTNLHLALNKVLEVAVKGHVAECDMPKTLLILSDMQFDQCVKFDHTAFEMIKLKYEQHGYTMPHIVFWNLNASDNVPVAANTAGAALISGFSPSIVKSVLANDVEQFTPFNIMMKTIMSDRYALA